MSTFFLRVVTPERDFYSGEIEYLCVDTPDGKAGFMRGALPRLAILSAGEIEIKTAVLEMKIISGDGFVSVDENGVTIICEHCRFADEEPDEAEKEQRVVRDKRFGKSFDFAKAKIASTIKKAKSGGHSEI